jgi:transposase
MKTKRSKAEIRGGQKRLSVICNAPEQKLEILRPDAAGIDCGAEEHYIAVPPDRVRAGEPTVRSFSAFTEGLDAAVEWLKACRVTTVAMESTGVYWIPLHQKLEAAGIEVYLVNARHVRHVPGRKTDVQDSQWLRQLHRFGLLNASFRPQDIICRLRSCIGIGIIWSVQAPRRSNTCRKRSSR